MFDVIATLMTEDLQSINNAVEMTKEQFFEKLTDKGFLFVKTENWQTGASMSIHWTAGSDLRREVQYADGSYLMIWDLDGNLIWND